MNGIFSERRLVKVVGTDLHGLPTEEIVRESIRRRLHLFMSRWLSALSFRRHARG